ncbi:fungal protein [Schizosaccharomyces japonicus yFS275]|uniref:Fungal protein n=1 Tax=Schizosaccharomyces japonicus (strain yFS275 / FY16936) TaxID=402676 RepID=B6K164_SCHJY|nr:fungal protein [Schizosaccharomyces japonicus yFS275]EEB07685.1 fungal protein [Schizosaccharomyces japonicus yFS275]
MPGNKLLSPQGLDKIAMLLVSVDRLSSPSTKLFSKDVVVFLNEFRCALRLPGLYNLVNGFHFQQSSFCQLVVTLVQMAYYLSEGLAFLSSKDVIQLPKRLENWLWLVSCRCWLIGTLIHFARLLLHCTSVSPVDLLDDFVIDLTALPMSLHWSLRRGCGLCTTQLGALGLVSAVTHLRRLLNES